MHSRSEESDPDRAPSSFRAAFSRARVEALESALTDGEGAPSRSERSAQGDPDARAARTFEVRIERRRGKRRAQQAAWNRLGGAGWELVAVTEKHAFFRRERS